MGTESCNHELVYRCDDDNLVHPNFFKGLTELTKQDVKMYIVAQDCDDKGYGGIVKTDEWFRCGNIDTVQMIFKNPYQEFKYEGTPPQDPKDTKHIDIQEDWFYKMSLEKDMVLKIWFLVMRFCVIIID